MGPTPNTTRLRENVWGRQKEKSLRRSIRTQGTFWLTHSTGLRLFLREGQGVRRQLGVAQGDQISTLRFWVTWTTQRWTRKPQSQGWLRSEFRGVRGGSAQEHSLCHPSPATQTPHPRQTTFPRIPNSTSLKAFGYKWV